MLLNWLHNAWLQHGGKKEKKRKETHAKMLPSSPPVLSCQEDWRMQRDPAQTCCPAGSSIQASWRWDHSFHQPDQDLQKTELLKHSDQNERVKRLFPPAKTATPAAGNTGSSGDKGWSCCGASAVFSVYLSGGRRWTSAGWWWWAVFFLLLGCCCSSFFWLWALICGPPQQIPPMDWSSHLHSSLSPQSMLGCEGCSRFLKLIGSEDN